ncbi:MAG: hypothetical protein QG556_851, partial [Pseudomonadota bacterium]|nr:hypothetical protein [Pseudomonadota bacterium]
MLNKVVPILLARNARPWAVCSILEALPLRLL